MPAVAAPARVVAPLAAVLALAGSWGAGTARAESAPSTAAAATPPPPPSAAPAPRWGEAIDEGLRRVLRSGCADGMSELETLGGGAGADAEVAREVVRLCREIRAARLGVAESAAGPEASPAGSASSPAAPDRRGRFRLIPALTLYGVWAGISVDVLAGIDNDRAVVLFPLLGMVAGLTGSLWATRSGEMPNGEAWSIITGLQFGTISGFLWTGAVDASSEKTYFAAGLASGVLAGAGGFLIGRAHPPQGAVEVVRSGGIWGFFTSLMVSLVFPSEPSNQALLTTLAIGMDGGLLAGTALAYLYPISVNRTLLIDTGAVAGLVLGAGGAWLIAGSSSDRQAIGVGGLIGLAAGIGTALWLTSGMDGDHDATARATVPALIVRDDRGRLRRGSLALVPVMGSGGSERRIVGATATLFGGAF